MLTTLFLSLLTHVGLQQADSVSNQWLINEWNESYEQELVQIEKEQMIFIVSMEGEVLHRLNKGLLSTLSEKQAIAYQQSDFLFSWNDDEYYLHPTVQPVAPPSETVQYSSAE